MDHENMYGENLNQEGMPSKQIVSKAAFALFVMAAVILLVQVGIDYLVANYSPSIAETNWYIWAVTALTVVVIGFPIYYLMIKRVPDSIKREPVKLKVSHFIVLFFVCTAAMYITNFFSVILTVVIALLKGDDLLSLNPLMEAVTGSNFVITLLYASLVAPIVEELIFRKLLLNKLRRFGDVPAILLTGFAFGLFHMNLSQFFYATVLGIIFAYVTIRTNTVKYSILLHIIINFIGTVVAPLAAGKNIVLLMLLVLWELVAITIGIVFFIVNIKKIKLEKAAKPLDKKSDYFLNLGTVLYTLLCIAMIIYVTVI